MHPRSPVPPNSDTIKKVLAHYVQICDGHKLIDPVRSFCVQHMSRVILCSKLYFGRNVTMVHSTGNHSLYSGNIHLPLTEGN